MAWEERLKSDQTIGTPFESNTPFVIRLEGDYAGKTYTLQSRRLPDGEFDDDEGQAITENPMLFYSFEDTEYRIKASESGATAYSNTVFTTQRDRLGR